MKARCYNSALADKNQRMRSLSLYRLALLAFLPAFLSIPAAPQNRAAPARELAEKIAAHVQARSAVTVSLRNLSSMSQNEAAQVRRAIEGELRSKGMQLVGAERAVDEIRLTLSENVEGYLWVAEVGHGDSWEVVMTQSPAPSVSDRSSPSFSIRKTLLWTQASQMLDFATADISGGTALLVLEPERLVLYRLVSGRWTLDGVVAVAHSQFFPRDVRGRVVLQRDGGYTAYLPGVQCTGSTQPHLLTLCKENDNNWPLGSNADGLMAVFDWSRDYFTGALVPGLGTLTKLPPFYSAAAIQERGTTIWLFTLVDGGTRLVSAKGETLGVISGSGSELASVRNECSADSLVLTTRAGDSTRPDAVQAYEMANGEPMEAGASAEFAGPLVSLWSTPEGNAVTAVSRNLKTKQYEAFTLTVACGR